MSHSGSENVGVKGTRLLKKDYRLILSTPGHDTTADGTDTAVDGTPAGVGAAQGRYLRHGDVVRVTIEGLGALEHIVYEPPGADLGASRAQTGATA